MRGHGPALGEVKALGYYPTKESIAEAVAEAPAVGKVADLHGH